MKLDADYLTDPDTVAVITMLEQAGHQAFFVGGCVRNPLLGAPVSDIDIATDARPVRVMALATGAGLANVGTGIDHGTITVLSGGEPYEVTTFRHDIETYGRRARVIFAETMEEDARRRDFTMNALYAKRDGTVLDPVGGLEDLAARRFRFIDDPSQRIREDYLRILRFFRFHAWYGDPAAGLDPDGYAACAELAEGIDSLSRERVGAEMTKLLGAPDPAPSLAAMAQAGVLARALPGADADKMALLVHLEAGSGVAASSSRRLALLGGEDVQNKLRLSREVTRTVALLREGVEAMTDPAEMAWRYGPDAARDVALIRAALFETELPADLEARIATGIGAVLPVSAADLMPGFEGAALGEELKRLESLWIASDFSMTREALLAG
ncbi:MAG: CCA tRNA nucleotidyltransferase [Brevirhabdus sp.]